jgi:thioredoxin 1
MRLTGGGKLVKLTLWTRVKRLTSLLLPQTARPRQAVKEFQVMSVILTLTDDNFETEVKKAALPVLVDFWAPWCGPCKAVGPIMEELAAEYDGRLVIAKLNVDENQAAPARFGIRSIPNLVLLKGGEEAGRIVGARTKDGFKAALEPLL